MKPLPLVFACSLVLVTACGRVEQQAKTTTASPTPEPDKRLAALLAPLEKAEKILVYEGLPHPNYEQELLAQEQQAKDTLTLHRCAFYKEPLKL